MKILYVIALLIAGGLSAAAQERILTEVEFTEIHVKAQSDLYKGVHGPFRQVLETATDIEGRPEVSYRLKSVSKTIPAQGTHRIEERSFGGKPSNGEIITLNNRVYLKGPDGLWKETTESSRSAATEPAKNPTADLQTIERKAEFKYLGIESTGSRKDHVYLMVERKKTLNTAKGTTSEGDLTVKVRISTTGDYYRYESNSKTLLSGGQTSTVKILIEVQADPTITITPPEMAK